MRIPSALTQILSPTANRTDDVSAPGPAAAAASSGATRQPVKSGRSDLRYPGLYKILPDSTFTRRLKFSAPPARPEGGVPVDLTQRSTGGELFDALAKNFAFEPKHWKDLVTNIETLSLGRAQDSLLGWPRTKKTFRLMYDNVFTKTNFDDKTIRNNLWALYREIGARKAVAGSGSIGFSASAGAQDTGPAAIDVSTLPWRAHAHLSPEDKRAALGLVRAAAYGGPNSPDLMIAFLNGLLAIQREPDAAPSGANGNATSTSASAPATATSRELERLHHTQAAPPAEQITIDPTRYGTAIENAGGGDCVIHALEGRDLTDDEMLVTRAELADIRRAIPDTETSQSANANLLATLLLDTPLYTENGLSLMQGRHAIPNRVLADFQAIPGGYAGVETIEQWVALPRNQDKTVVSIELEQRKGDLFRDGKRIEPSLSINSKEDLMKLDDMVRDASVVLYLKDSHWKQIKKSSTWNAAGKLNESESK